MYPEKIPSLTLLAAGMLLPLQAFAYVGPGLGAGTIGVILGLLGSIFLALFAFFWYPIKRALFSKATDAEDEDDDLDGVADVKAQAKTERSRD